MVKQDIIVEVAEMTGSSEYEAKVAVNAVFNVIKDALNNGDEVIIRGFGSFKQKERKPKLVRNLNTGTTFWTARKVVVAFEPGKEIQNK